MAYDSKGTVNKVILIGRIGQDPEFKYTPSNTALVNLSVATNTGWKSSDGQQQEATEWSRVTVWRQTAEYVSKYAKKGTRVYVEGKLQTRQWEDKDGNTRYTTEIIADQVQILDGGQSRSSEPTEQVPENNPMEGDDLPF